jgi:site-specific recombinase XerD
MSIVSRYKRGGVWYLRTSKRYGFLRISTHTKDAKIAEALRLEEERRLLFGGSGNRMNAVSPVRFSEFVAAFIEAKAGEGRAYNTTETYRYSLNNLGFFLGEDKRVNEITLDDFEHFAAARRAGTIVAGKKTLKPASEKTIRNDLITVAVAFKWAERKKYVRENPAKHLELPKKVKRPPRNLRAEEMKSLRASIADEEFRDVVDFYHLTGIRRSEGVALRYSEHVDFERKVLTIPQPKQSDYKEFPIREDLRRVIVRMKVRAGGDDRIVRYGEGALTKLFRKYADDAGLPKKLTFHSLRHTFATNLASSGVDAWTIQTLLGHKDPESTRVYVHAYNQNLREALDKLPVTPN